MGSTMAIARHIKGLERNPGSASPLARPQANRVPPALWLDPEKAGKNVTTQGQLGLGRYKLSMWQAWQGVEGSLPYRVDPTEIVGMPEIGEGVAALDRALLGVKGRLMQLDPTRILAELETLRTSLETTALATALGEPKHLIQRQFVEPTSWMPGYASEVGQAAMGALEEIMSHLQPLLFEPTPRLRNDAAAAGIAVERALEALSWRHRLYEGKDDTDDNICFRASPLLAKPAAAILDFFVSQRDSRLVRNPHGNFVVFHMPGFTECLNTDHSYPANVEEMDGILQALGWSLQVSRPIEVPSLRDEAGDLVRDPQTKFISTRSEPSTTVFQVGIHF